MERIGGIQPDPFAWHEIRLRRSDGALRHAIITSQAVGPDEVPGNAPRSRKTTRPAGSCSWLPTSRPSSKPKRRFAEKESVLRSFYDSSEMAMGVVELSEDDAYFLSANALTDNVFRRRDRQAGREIRPAAQGPAAKC